MNSIVNPASELAPVDMLFEIDKLVWMTSDEAAKYLRKTVGALRTAIYRGQIRGRKFRRRLYFKRSELDRMLEASSN